MSPTNPAFCTLIAFITATFLRNISVQGQNWLSENEPTGRIHQYLQGWRAHFTEPSDADAYSGKCTANLGTFNDPSGHDCLDACDAFSRTDTDGKGSLRKTDEMGRRCRFAQYNLDTGRCTGFLGGHQICSPSFIRHSDYLLLVSTRKKLYQSNFYYFPSYPNCPGFTGLNRSTDVSYLMANTLATCQNLCLVHPHCSQAMFAADTTAGKQYGQCWLLTSEREYLKASATTVAPSYNASAVQTDPPLAVGYVQCLLSWIQFILQHTRSMIMIYWTHFFYCRPMKNDFHAFFLCFLRGNFIVLRREVIRGFGSFWNTFLKRALYAYKNR